MLTDAPSGNDVIDAVPGAGVSDAAAGTGAAAGGAGTSAITGAVPARNHAIPGTATTARASSATSTGIRRDWRALRGGGMKGRGPGSAPRRPADGGFSWPVRSERPLFDNE